MAAGIYDRSLDSRVSCSICLEPYRGRQPKLLPCSHTFCLPCLTQITNRIDSQLVGGAGDGNGAAAAAPVTLTCPTCRTPVPLPPAGVSGLHNNVYVDDSLGHDPRPLLCDLCEEGQSAKLNCSTCKAYFCTRCRRFHDKLCKTGQVTEIQVLQTGAREKILSPQASLEPDVTDVKSLTAVVQQLMQKQTETEKQVAMLQNQNALLCRDLASLHEKNGRERKEFDALQCEVVSQKDKNAIVCQDNQLLRNDVTKLQDHTTKLQGEVDKHQVELSQLKTQTSQTQGQGEITALKNSQAQLQGEVESLKTQQSVLQADVKKATADQGKLQSSLTSLESDKTRLQDDVKKVKADQGGMQSNFDRTRNKLQDDLKKISTQVAFHARLANKVEPKKNDIIVCSNVQSNVGGGYNKVTGIFTAPVSGVYCFVANATSHSSDATKGCSANIVIDGDDVAHLLAFGRGNCTVHVSLSVKAGQKVWLKSFDDVSHFHAGWLTSFTGFLVQVDL